MGYPPEGELRGLRRVRVGDYRVVYEVLDGELVVLVVPVAEPAPVHRVERWSRTPHRFGA